MKPFPSHYVSHLGQSTTVFQPADNTPSSRLLVASPHRPAQCWCALQRSHVELLQHVFHGRRIDSEVMIRSTELLVELQDGNARHVLSLETLPEKWQERFLEDKRTARESCSVRQKPQPR